MRRNRRKHNPWKGASFLWMCAFLVLLLFNITNSNPGAVNTKISVDATQQIRLATSAPMERAQISAAVTTVPSAPIEEPTQKTLWTAHPDGDQVYYATAAPEAATPKPTAAPTARAAAAPSAPIEEPTQKPLRTAHPDGDRIYYATAALEPATPKPTAAPTAAPTARSAALQRAAAAVKADAPQPAKKNAWVIGESANVREGPSTDYAVVEKLYYGDKLYSLELVETSAGKWVRVQTESGKTGYASMKLLSDHDPGAPSSSNNNNNNSNRGQTNRQTQNQTQNQSQSRTVYVSRTGECYHSYSGCSNMSNPLVMSEDEAIARGRRRCRKCW